MTITYTCHCGAPMEGSMYMTCSARCAKSEAERAEAIRKAREPKKVPGLYEVHLVDGTCTNGGLRESVLHHAASEQDAVKWGEKKWNVGPGSWDSVSAYLREVEA